MTWRKVINCVNTELFPVLSIALRKCIDEKLSEENDFKLTDFGLETVADVLDRLKRKRTMNDKEIEYLKALFIRAIDSTKKRLVFTFNNFISIILCYIFEFHASLSTQNQMKPSSEMRSARITVQSGQA